jgi:hypothetical protein
MVIIQTDDNSRFVRHLLTLSQWYVDVIAWLGDNFDVNFCQYGNIVIICSFIC